MEHLLPCIFCLFLLAGCHEKELSQVPNSALLAKLQQAEEVRFSNQEVLDTLLVSCLDDVQMANSAGIWAKYYYIKAHAVEKRSHFGRATLLMDSAIHHGLYDDKAYIGRVILFDAIINEQLLLFKKALELLNSLCHQKEGCLLTPDEMLIVHLAKARIAKRLRLPFTAHLDNAEALISQHDDMNMGLLFSNKAFLTSDRKEKITYGKLALNYYSDRNMPLKLFKCYYNMASHYVAINLDSSLHYMHKAQLLHLEPRLVALFSNSIEQCYYFYNYAIVLFCKHDYEQALEYIHLALPISESLGLENVLYGLKTIKSDIFFSQGHYLSSKKLAKEASGHFYTYKLKASENQIQYLEAKTHVEKVLKENQYYLLKLKSSKQSNHIFLLVSILLVSLILVLIFWARSIKEQLLLSYERMNIKDVSIFNLENRMTVINEHIAAKLHPEKVVLSKIDKELKATNTIASWDAFYLMYTHKYPEGHEQFKQRFPDLTPMEMQYALCIHYGLSDEKIAHLFKIKIASIRKRRQRLRQVLALTPDDDIKDCLSHALTKRPNKR